jgi:hypothetical protein
MSSSIYAARPWNQLYMSSVAPWLAPQTFRGLRKRLHVMEQRETMSLVENARLQWQAVGRLLQHAYDTTPLLSRAIRRAGITPAQITSPQDLQRIPDAHPQRHSHPARRFVVAPLPPRGSAGRGDRRDYGYARAACCARPK